MPPPLDLTGNEYGDLIPLELLKKRDKHGKRQWKCQCKRCRGLVTTRTGALTSGGQKSCPRCKFENLIGQEFNELRVCRLLPKSDKHGKRRWKAQCKRCKRYTIVTTGDLKSGNTKSCSCLRRIKKPRREVMGQTFGTLRPLTYKRTTKDGHYRVQVHCDPQLGGCGRKKVVSGHDLVMGKTKSCGCRNPLKKGRVKAAFKAKERIVEAGVEWYSPGLTARLLKINPSTLNPSRRGRYPGWKASCPWLPGRQWLIHKPMRGPLGKEIDYFHGPTVEKAILAKGAGIKAKRQSQATNPVNGHPQPLPSASPANGQAMTTTGQAVEPPAGKEVKRRGRPSGSIDTKAADRNEKMRQAWREGKHASIAKLARAFHVSRSHASEIINQ